MEFGLSEEQAFLQDNLNRFLDQNASLDRVRNYAATPTADDIWQGLTELGIPALMVPERFGGVGLGTLEAALVAESLGAHVTPAPFISTAVLLPLAVSGADDAIQQSVLGEVVEGKLRAGTALSHAFAARGDVGVTASGGKLTGRSLFVLDADASNFLVADDNRGMHLVVRDAEGVAVKGLTTVDRTRQIGELTLDGSPAIQLSADPELLLKVVDTARVMLAADTLGAAQHMLDAAVAYSHEREQFNRPIGSFQAVKHMCAEMVANLEPCRSMVWYAAHSQDNIPDEARLVACHTKAHVAEVGTFVTRTATEVHGGMGFTDLLGLHYWFKRAGLNRQLFGSPELVREEAAAIQDLA